MMLTKHFVRVGLAAVTTTILASCGGDDPSAADNTTPKASVFVLSAIPDEKITRLETIPIFRHRSTQVQTALCELLLMRRQPPEELPELL